MLLSRPKKAQAYQSRVLSLPRTDWSLSKPTLRFSWADTGVIGQSWMLHLHHGCSPHEVQCPTSLVSLRTKRRSTNAKWHECILEDVETRITTSKDMRAEVAECSRRILPPPPNVCAVCLQYIPPSTDKSHRCSRFAQTFNLSAVGPLQGITNNEVMPRLGVLSLVQGVLGICQSAATRASLHIYPC
jgi:hypothetical protein